MKDGGVFFKTISLISRARDFVTIASFRGSNVRFDTCNSVLLHHTPRQMSRDSQRTLLRFRIVISDLAVAHWNTRFYVYNALGYA